MMMEKEVKELRAREERLGGCRGKAKAREAKELTGKEADKEREKGLECREEKEASEPGPAGAASRGAARAGRGYPGAARYGSD